MPLRNNSAPCKSNPTRWRTSWCRWRRCWQPPRRMVASRCPASSSTTLAKCSCCCNPSPAKSPASNHFQTGLFWGKSMQQAGQKQLISEAENRIDHAVRASQLPPPPGQVVALAAGSTAVIWPKSQASPSYRNRSKVRQRTIDQLEIHKSRTHRQGVLDTIICPTHRRRQAFSSPLPPRCRPRSPGSARSAAAGTCPEDLHPHASLCNEPRGRARVNEQRTNAPSTAHTKRVTSTPSIRKYINFRTHLCTSGPAVSKQPKR